VGSRSGPPGAAEPCRGMLPAPARSSLALAGPARSSTPHAEHPVGLWPAPLPREQVPGLWQRAQPSSRSSRPHTACWAPLPESAQASHARAALLLTGPEPALLLLPLALARLHALVHQLGGTRAVLPAPECSQHRSCSPRAEAPPCPPPRRLRQPVRARAPPTSAALCSYVAGLWSASHKAASLDPGRSVTAFTLAICMLARNCELQVKQLE